MKPDQLRTFLAVCKHRSYSRAAEEVLLSQPAVWRQVRQLADELGVELFEPIGKTLHLTDAGRTLVSEAEQLLGSLDRIVEIVRGHRGPERGRIRIGASTTPGLYLLPRVLGKFHREFPGVDLQYAVENSMVIERRILRNEIDLGIVGGHLSHEDIQATPIVTDRVVCFAGVSHRLAKRRRIDVTDLEDETWVMREKGSATRRLFESWFTKAGGRITRTIELQNPEAVKALVAEGLGISFLSIHGLDKQLGSKRLVRLPVSGMRLQRPILFVRHTDKHLSPAMQAFISLAERTLTRKERRRDRTARGR